MLAALRAYTKTDEGKAKWKELEPLLSKPTASPTCDRCEMPLNEEGYCTDDTCPFSDHKQTCMVGWSGCPGKDPYPNDDGVGPCSTCTCGGRVRTED